MSTPKRETVPAYPLWAWDCEECGHDNMTEFSPPSDETCEGCGHEVRTDQR